MPKKPDISIAEKEPQIYIRCNEGPPQVVASMAIPLPVKVMHPGMIPPMRIEHGAMRPVLSPDKPACGRHIWRSDANKPNDPDAIATCGNCGHGVPFTRDPEATDGVSKLPL